MSPLSQQRVSTQENWQFTKIVVATLSYDARQYNGYYATRQTHSPYRNVGRALTSIRGSQLFPVCCAASHPAANLQATAPQ